MLKEEKFEDDPVRQMYITSKVSLYHVDLALNGSNQSSITTMVLWDMRCKYPTRCRNLPKSMNIWTKRATAYIPGERRIGSISQTGNKYRISGIFSTSNKIHNTWIYKIEFWKRFPSCKHTKSNFVSVSILHTERIEF